MRTTKRTDKELAETCIFFDPLGTYKDDGGKPSCRAHSVGARTFDCDVWLGREHISGERHVNKCQGFKAKESRE